MSHYRTGTISLTNGSLSVVGSGTDFISGAAVGECVSAPDGKIYEIASIQSATALTLGTVYLGSTSSGQAYSIVPTQSYLRDLALQAATLVNDYQSVLDSAGAGKFGDGTLASPGIQFSSDSNSGIRRTGTDALAVVTGGVDRITVDAAGAVAVVASLSVAGSAVPTIASTSTLTNKTLALGSNTISGTLAQFNTAVTDADLASLAGTETLTNKTLTAPVLANPSYSGATANGGTVTTIDINGGTIDGTVIGGTTPAAVSATTLSASGQIQANSAGAAIKITGVAANPAYMQVDNTAQSGKIWRAGYSGGSGGSANTFDIYDQTDNINVGVFSSTGLAVTGTLSATTSVTAGSGSAGLVMRGYTGSSSYGALYRVGDTPSDTNAQLISNAVTTILNGTTSSTLAVGAVNVAVATASGLAVTGALSCTGNTTLGDAAGDTLNVANGSLLLDASGNLGLGVTPSARSSNLGFIDFQGQGAIGGGLYMNTSSMAVDTNCYNLAGYKYKLTGHEATRYVQGSGTHYWFTAPSGTAGNAITFTQSLAVGLGTTLALEGATSATGTGIAFPATQVASSNANTLDDYEEGTWTPTQGAGLVVVGGFSSSGIYTKVGRQVTAYGQVMGVTSVTAVAGTVMCGGLPFTAALQYQGAGANSSGATGFVVAVAGTNVYSVDASSTAVTQCFSVTYTV